MTVELHLGDCLEVMKEIPSSSIDCTVTSPPYDGMRQYKSGSTFDFEGIANQLFRITSQGGVVVWVVGDETKDGDESGTSFRQALGFKEVGFKLWDTMIYQKSNPVPKNHPRYEQAFEYMFVLTKNKPKTVSLMMERCKRIGEIGHGSHRKNGHELVAKWGMGVPTKETRPRINIWTYGVGFSDNGHPAEYPIQLAMDHISTWTSEGDTVLDCFLGSGTTGIAAKQLGRNFTGIEIDPTYFAIAERRIKNAKRGIYTKGSRKKDQGGDDTFDNLLKGQR